MAEKEKEDWMQKKWRPMMGWMYMCVCTFDFMVAPILWSLIQALSHGNVSSQWQPLTLQGAGLFHLAMGGILGIAAYGRTQEKMAGAAAGNGLSSASTPSTPTPTPVATSTTTTVTDTTTVTTKPVVNTRAAVPMAASQPSL